MDWTVVAAFIGLAAVVSFIKALGKRTPVHTVDVPYETKGALLTNAERSFFGVLEQAVGNDLRIFAKVRVADVISPKKGMSRSDWQSAFNKITAKHFDFVLCHPQTLDIWAVVELNDKSHNGKRGAARDDFLRQACAAAQVNLIEVQAKRGYSVEELREALPVATVHA